MKLILFILVLVLLLIFTNNKREFFNEKIIGDISYENYKFESTKKEHGGEKTSIIDEFYQTLIPRKMSYTIGEEGIGVSGDPVNSFSFKPENVKKLFGDLAINKIGGKEIVNLEALVPIIFYGSQNNYKKIENLLVELSEIKKDMKELEKTLPPKTELPEIPTT